MAWIGYASDASSARIAFENRFGSFFGRAAKVAEGVVLNEVTEHLVTVATHERLSKLAGKAHVDFYAQVHINAG